MTLEKRLDDLAVATSAIAIMGLVVAVIIYFGLGYLLIGIVLCFAALALALSATILQILNENASGAALMGIIFTGASIGFFTVMLLPLLAL